MKYLEGVDFDEEGKKWRGVLEGYHSANWEVLDAVVADGQKDACKGDAPNDHYQHLITLSIPEVSFT